MGTSLPGSLPARTRPWAVPHHIGTESAPSRTSSSFHGMPAYSGITTRTSRPRARSAFGSALATSARPPVFENGAHSDATKRTLSGAALPVTAGDGAGASLTGDLAVFSPSPRLRGKGRGEESAFALAGPAFAPALAAAFFAS